jgi:hypothetical protein
MIEYCECQGMKNMVKEGDIKWIDNRWKIIEKWRIDNCPFCLKFLKSPKQEKKMGEKIFSICRENMATTATREIMHLFNEQLEKVEHKLFAIDSGDYWVKKSDIKEIFNNALEKENNYSKNEFRDKLELPFREYKNGEIDLQIAIDKILSIIAEAIPEKKEVRYHTLDDWRKGAEGYNQAIIETRKALGLEEK